MERNASADPGSEPADGTDLELTVDVAGRRLVYAANDLEAISFDTLEQ